MSDVSYNQEISEKIVAKYQNFVYLCSPKEVNLNEKTQT